MMQCARCGAGNQPTSKYCLSCGAPLPAASAGEGAGRPAPPPAYVPAPEQQRDPGGFAPPPYAAPPPASPPVWGAPGYGPPPAAPEAPALPGSPFAWGPPPASPGPAAPPPASPPAAYGAQSPAPFNYESPPLEPFRGGSDGPNPFGATLSPQEQAAQAYASGRPLPPLPPPVLGSPYAPELSPLAPAKHDPAAFAPTSLPPTREEHEAAPQRAPQAYAPQAYSPSAPPAYGAAPPAPYMPSAPPAYSPSVPVYSPAAGQAYPSNPPPYAAPAPPPLPSPVQVSQPPPLPGPAFNAAPRDGAGRDPDHVEAGALRSLAGFLVSYEQSDLGIFWPIYQGQNVLGRKGAAAGLDVEVDHPTTSSRHAVLYASARPARVKVEDTGSTNGTYVGEQPIERGRRHELRDGDVIRFGGFSAIIKLV